MVNGFPILSVLWSLPLGGAALVAALRPAMAKYVATGVALLVLTVAIVLAINFDPAGERYQFVETHRWIPSFGAGYLLGVDGIAVVLVVLTAVLMPIILLAAWHDTPAPQAYCALMLSVQALVLVSFLALDVLLFFVVFEAMLIPMYFLIGRYGGADAGRAALKFLLYSLFGGLLMLAAMVGLYVVTSGTFDFRAIVEMVSSGDLHVHPLLLNGIFLGFMVAFAIKAPLWPCHTWLPGAAAEATPATAVLMMAVVDKVGTFGMLRYCLQLFPEPSTLFRPFIITLAVTGILYGAIVAIGQTDIMRLIAYTSISHFGFIILGIFAMTSQGQSGSTLYMVNHGISTAALFLIAGFLVSRRGSRLIASYGGVQKVAPVLAGTFLVAGLATLALPGLAPFISEFLVLIGTFTYSPPAAVIASIALILSAVYILLLYQRLMTGPVTDANKSVRDLVPREIAVVAPLIALLLVLGIYPEPALDIINPAVEHTLTTVDQQDPAVAEGAVP
jgi:NADH-quinone oxidoreductase subunit M